MNCIWNCKQRYRNACSQYIIKKNFKDNALNERIERE